MRLAVMSAVHGQSDPPKSATVVAIATPTIRNSAEPSPQDTNPQSHEAQPTQTYQSDPTDPTESGQIRNPQSLRAGGRSGSEATIRNSPPAPPPPPPPSAKELAFAKLQLQSILYSPTTATAVISGTRVRSGDKLPAGATVVEIGPSSVTLEFENERKILALK
jgi:hypothetical protein